jgi:hypothetical protein
VVARSASGPGPAEAVALGDPAVVSEVDDAEDDADDDVGAAEVAEGDEAADSLPPSEEHPVSARAPTAAAQNRDVPNFGVAITRGF